MISNDISHRLSPDASIFSHVLGPFYVPVALLFTEPPGRRRRALLAFVAAGVAVGAYLLYAMIVVPIVSRPVASGTEECYELSPLAAQPAPPAMRVNGPRLVTAYYAQRQDPSEQQQRVQFGTSGHRGSAFDDSFNEMHIVALTRAICDAAVSQGRP